MSRAEMMRQSAAAMNKPPAEEPPPAPLPGPLPEPSPASQPRPRKSPPPHPNPATSEQIAALSQQIGEMIQQRQSDEQKTASLNELAELAGQMGASLAKLSDEYRKVLPRIMDEPKQQTAAMLQEVRTVLQEMKSALKETSNAAQDIQRAASRVNGLSLKTWLGQAGTCLIVSAALLLGFSIWQPRQTREARLKELNQTIVEANMETLRQAKQENLLNKPATGQQKQFSGKQKPLDATATKSESALKQPETPPPAEPVQWSTTNGAPPK